MLDRSSHPFGFLRDDRVSRVVEAVKRHRLDDAESRLLERAVNLGVFEHPDNTVALSVAITAAAAKILELRGGNLPLYDRKLAVDGAATDAARGLERVQFSPDRGVIRVI